MRTTLTLDDDVARLVQDEARRSGESFKGTINHLLRLGLTSARKPEKKKRFVVTPIALNSGLGTRYRNVNELLEALEGPSHR
ncbi:MAG TPA: hypothetical protein VF730_09935 [Terracidiphilus sp.]